MIAKRPVAVVHVGCVTVPNVGTSGVAGRALIIALEEAEDEQVPKVAVTVYVPAGAVTSPAASFTPSDGLNAYS